MDVNSEETYHIETFQRNYMSMVNLFVIKFSVRLISNMICRNI